MRHQETLRLTFHPEEQITICYKRVIIVLDFKEDAVRSPERILLIEFCLIKE